jgi:tRNA (cytidine/uridine-2'-O-)-methyltransferase
MMGCQAPRPQSPPESPGPRLALFEPDIPQNTGAMLRLAACLGVGVDVIEPCGFVWSDRHLRRAGMDYLELAALRRHPSWDSYVAARAPEAGRIVLLTTAGGTGLWRFRFAPNDTLLVGRESSGVSDAVRAAAHASVRIPMRAGARSFNVALAAALALGEALRQTGRLPQEEETTT